ncbi:MAG: MtrB/PioB family decaheme-associated outer membrane protein [candidate division Zixibacteria bacterium]|nr:MtrB/PioB family decaheme-associated outer membrane protein [candidate division Zixibacteria bacterium]
MKKLILTILAGGWATIALAQEEAPTANGGGYQTSGFFEGGFWQVLKDPGSAKFQEYRQVKEYLLLNRFGFNLSKENYYLGVNANELGKTDQRATARFGLVRKWKNKVTWSQTPHLYSTSTRASFLNAGGGVFILPDSIQAALSSGSSSAVTAKLKSFLDGAQPFELSAQRNTGGVTSEFKPRSDLTVKAGYINERKTGNKQLGVTIGFNPVELPEPLNYETHRFSASAELARKDFSAAVAYSGRVFNNKTEAVIRDNLFRVTTDSVSAPLRARLALPVDNMSHNFTFTGTYNLPKRTRSVATVSYGVATQNEDFLPHTINSALSDTGLVIRRLEDGSVVTSLDGKFKTFLFNYQISSRPVEKLTLKGKARYYEFDNQTPELFFTSRVSYDASVDTFGRANLPYEYIKRSGGAEAGYELIRQVHASLGYTREGISRNHREVEASNEDIYNGTLDIRPNNWVTVRSSYVHSERKTQKYDTLFFEESFPEGESVTNPAMSLNELRRFDVYNRKRDKVELTSQLSPIDELDVGLNFSFAEDDFSADYGLEALWNLGWGIDVSYIPVPRLTLFGDIGREDGRGEMESRYRAVVANVGYDSLNNDWSGYLRDRFENYGFGFSAEVWPKKLDWGANYGFTYSRSALLSTFAPGGVAAGNAVSFPNVYYKLHRIGSQVSYRLTSQTALKFSYWYEKYLETDWAIDPLQPFMPIATRSVFLGFRIPDYEAHILALKLSYAF